MRHRAFAFKGKKKIAKAELKKILKKKKMPREVSGDAISFKGAGMSPLIGYFGLTEDGKVTHVEMYVKTAWWYYIISLLVIIGFFVLGYYFYKVDHLVATLAFIVGLFQFVISFMISIVIEKKGELFLTNQLHMKKFF
jgi:hypothetical protein